MSATAKEGLEDYRPIHEHGFVDEQDDDEERDHFLKVVMALFFYKEHQFARVVRARMKMKRLPRAHQAMLKPVVDKLSQYQHIITTNTELLQRIGLMSGVYTGPDDLPQHLRSHKPSDFDMDKVYTTLKQFYRDWSAQGAEERASCYGVILDCVDKLFEDRPNETVRVLTPGAGLGRLAWEFAHRGYISQGNEFSAYMLFGANFILNGQSGPEAFSIFPFAHQFCNQFSTKAQLQEVKIPDVDPSSLPPNSDFSMCAGDFLSVYTEPDSWDCIACSFFLDTAKNIVDYLETCFRILKPGGYLVNLGPLLYHFADDATALTVELTYDEVIHVVQAVGFEIKENRFPLPCTYNSHDETMMKVVYQCAFLCAQRPMTPAPSSGKERLAEDAAAE
eukprot:m.13397 g.13397  ORF g.13397 m.13397 type:complete len:391 (-) comp5940_c0_seq2:32-1204(-)